MTYFGPAVGPGPAEYPPPPPLPPPGARAASTQRTRWQRAEVRALAALVGGQVTAGAVVGLLWLAWSPRTTVFLVSGYGAGLTPIPDESENQFAGDGRFLVLCLAVGFVAGALAWLLVRGRRGVVPMIAIAAGGVLSSLVAAGVGYLFSSGSNSGAPDTAIHPPLSLHSPTMLIAESFIAVLVYVVLAGLDPQPSLRDSPGISDWPYPIEQPTRNEESNSRTDPSTG